MKQQLTRLHTVTTETIVHDGSNLLFVKIGELRIRVWFGVVENLAIYILLGTLFIDKYIREIFSSERNFFHCTHRRCEYCHAITTQQSSFSYMSETKHASPYEVAEGIDIP